MKTRNNKAFILFYLLILAASLLVLFFTLFLNNIVVSIRIQELKNFLIQINRQESNIDYLHILSKYKMHKQLYENQISEKELDSKEIELTYLLANYQNLDQEAGFMQYPVLTKPVLLIMNGVRRILGKDAITSETEDKDNRFLMPAYYFERNKQYKKALALYEKALEQDNIAQRTVYIIKLHQGFCKAIIGENTEATKLFNAIINHSSSRDLTLAAYYLLRYMDFFQQEAQKIKQSKADSLAKSQQLFQLLAYEEAKNILEKESTNKEDKNAITYLKARINEETGNTVQSVKLYQQIIEDDHESEYAKKANRRILITGTLNKEAESLKELAKENNKLLQDPDFEEMQEKAEKVSKLELDEEIIQQAETESQPSRKIEDPQDPQDSEEKQARNNDENNNQPFAEFSQKSIQNIEKKIEEKKLEKQEEQKAKPSPVPQRWVRQIPKKSPAPKAVKTPQKSPPPVKKDAKTEQTNQSILENMKKQANIVKPFYNKQGQIFKVEVYSPQNEFLYYVAYTYDDDGNLYGIAKYNKDGSPYTE